MCTVTWLPSRDGFELRVNRDEKRTRSVAFPPSIFERGGVRVISPRDVDGGGTWISVNDSGVALALLNGQSGAGARQGTRSRGLLVDELSGSTSVSEARMTLGRASLDQFSPFTLLVIEPGVTACIARWNGSTLTVDGAAPLSGMLTSSSVEWVEVSESRSGVYAELVRTLRGPSAEMLERFHRGHDPSRGFRSVCMHRDDAETVSFTRVAVCRDAALMHYEDGPPCDALRFDPVAISRRAAATRRPMAGVR